MKPPNLFGVLFSGVILLASVSAALEARAQILLEDHPLTETLWHTSDGETVEPSRFVEDAAAARYVLLGEKHDNPRHHALQAEMLLALVEAGRRPAVVWEMVGPEQSAALQAATPGALDSLGPALEWEARGWPDWASYAPIAKVALDYGLPLADGQPPLATIRTLGRGGELDGEAAARIGWDRTYRPDQLEPLLEQLAVSHCGFLPEEALPAMADVQRLRDAWMAARMEEAAQAGSGTAVLIAGAQHVREDRAVPWFLDADAVTIAFVEVARDMDDPKAYASFDPALFDYVWFTARMDEDDPCEKFREQMQGGKEG